MSQNTLQVHTVVQELRQRVLEIFASFDSSAKVLVLELVALCCCIPHLQPAYSHPELSGSCVPTFFLLGLFLFFSRVYAVLSCSHLQVHHAWPLHACG